MQKLTTKHGDYIPIKSLQTGDEETSEWMVLMQAPEPPKGRTKTIDEEIKQDNEIIRAVHEAETLPFVAPMVEHSEWDCTGRWCPQPPTVTRWKGTLCADGIGVTNFGANQHFVTVSQRSVLDV